MQAAGGALNCAAKCYYAVTAQRYYHGVGVAAERTKPGVHVPARQKLLLQWLKAGGSIWLWGYFPIPNKPPIWLVFGPRPVACASSAWPC
jgi:hypothetical protein